MIKCVNKNKKKKGFTLIELIIVIAILAILALVLVPMIGGYRDKAEASDIKASATTAMSAIEAYNAEHPDTTSTTDPPITVPNSTTNGLNKLYTEGTLDEAKVPDAVKRCTTVTSTDKTDFLDLQNLSDGNFAIANNSGNASTVKAK